MSILFLHISWGDGIESETRCQAYIFVVEIACNIISPSLYSCDVFININC